MVGSAGKGPAGSDFWTGPFGPDAFEKIAERHRHSLERMAQLQSAFLERMQRAQEMEVEFATRLARCTSPSEFVELMGQWSTARVEMAMEAQKQLQAMIADTAAEVGETSRRR